MLQKSPVEVALLVRDGHGKICGTVVHRVTHNEGAEGPQALGALASRARSC
jgi:hypothetical protein